MSSSDTFPEPTASSLKLRLPRVVAYDAARKGNRVQQLARLAQDVEGTLIPFQAGSVTGHLFRTQQSDDVLVVANARNLPKNYQYVLEAQSASNGPSADAANWKWLRHPWLRAATAVHEPDRVLESWRDAFSYVLEDTANQLPGLRNPQLGALHAISAHWSVSAAPATIVLPTGTGKTDTMIAILVAERCPRVLVIVPTDALRVQIFEKFLTLGILKHSSNRMLRETALFPRVGMLRHVPTSVDDVEEVFHDCHVIVATSSIAGQCSPEVQVRMAELCPYLFIDEAHHAEAPSWNSFRTQFAACKVVQFTATPFREDGKPLDGVIVYKYPLRKAQAEGYFNRINFLPVVEFNPSLADQAIAEQAVAQLRRDESKGHILMARVDSVQRAETVFKLYEKYSEYLPVQLHTGIKSNKRRNEIRDQLISGQSRIVVCVDMLGEGFDLPELKIAAFHDIRRSLAVTLQLAGRFTRARTDLGEAAFVANTADVLVHDELRKLYSRDPDWNVLLGELSESMIGKQVSLQEFLGGFTQFADEIPIRSVRPATSMVAYRTSDGSWSPEKFDQGIPGIRFCEQVHSAVNHEKNTLVIVTAKRVPLPWTDVESLFSWEWELYVLIWSPDQKLLFINSSSNAGEYRSLAKAVCGDDVSLIAGQTVFRTFAGVKRLRLQNVGLTEQLGRNVRYTGRMGSDVEPALPEAQRRRTRKSVLSGTGYENGRRVTVGASRKGRIWSHARERIDSLAAWCRTAGSKLLDDTIDPDEVLKGTLNTEILVERPLKMPIGIDWPEEMYVTTEAEWWITVNGIDCQLAEVDIVLVEPGRDGPLCFALESGSERAELELQLFEDGDTPNYRFVARGEASIEIRRGYRSSTESIVDFFYENPPVIWFVDGSSLEGNQSVQLRTPHPPYDAAKIVAWDWAGTDIRRESQGTPKDPTSIQYRVIETLRAGDYSVIVDDDGKGEAADVVAIRLTNIDGSPKAINVEFYHCKFSQDSKAGARIDDLYVVCGQAQRSVSWMTSPEKQTDIFTHLLRREARRRSGGGESRIEVGSKELLLELREMSRLVPIQLAVFVVQPGLSKSSISADQLQLLGVSENHLRDTFQLPFGVISSE